MEEKRRSQGSNSQPQPPPATTTNASPKSGEPPPPPQRRRKNKRKSTSSFSPSSSSSAPPPKRHAREKAAAAAAVAAAAAGGFPSSLFHNGPLTRARQMSDNNNTNTNNNNNINNNNNNDNNNAAVKNEDPTVVIESSGKGTDGRDEVKVVKEVEEKKEDNYDAIEAEIEKEFVSIRSRDSNSHVVPVTAGWFSWTDIHPLEKQAMHSFFNEKSETRTPEIYLEIRNWIMKRFHSNPNTNIELKDLTDLSLGDMDTKQEVMEFLDHWGLINYHPFHQSEPNIMDDTPNTDVDNPDKPDSLIDKLYQFEDEQSQSQFNLKGNAATLAMTSGLFPESAIAEELVKQEGPSVEYHCNSCSADCSRKRYHCQKEADFDLCAECYNNSKFGSHMCPSDFILMEPGEPSGASGGKWTDQETLLLLEALELFKENWNEIAEHVATKTKAQCILHFLQMPIEDSFIDAEDAMKDNTERSLEDSKIGPDESGSGSAEAETLESKSNKDDGEPLSGGKDDDVDISQGVPIVEGMGDAKDGKVSQGGNDNVVMMALMDAFDAVGSPFSPGDKISFAESANPVMALTAFLSRLVDPGVAIASARTSLRSISKTSSGSQLASRHCFLLEDPPDSKTDETDPKSAMSANTCQNPPKPDNLESKNENETNPNDVNSTSPIDDAIQKDRSTDVCAEKQQVVAEEKSEKSVVEKSDKDMDKSDKDMSEVAEKHGEISVEKTGLKVLGESLECTEAAKEVDVGTSQKVVPNGVAGVGSETGADKIESDNPEVTKSIELKGVKDDPKVAKLKRAALATLSAASVKAKLLANQEEDEIRQLASQLIEKQLRKLEIKLGFFTELDNAIMRVRDQLDRSRQRLINERAQIIASRLGLSGSMSRVLPSSLPINRMPPGLLNSMMRPPMNMGGGAQRPPPMLRPSAPPPGGVAGGSAQPTAFEKASSVGTN